MLGTKCRQVVSYIKEICIYLFMFRIPYKFRLPKKQKFSKTQKSNNEKGLEDTALFYLDELDRYTIPPTPDLKNLKIDYAKEEFLHMGHIKAIMGALCKF